MKILKTIFTVAVLMCFGFSLNAQQKGLDNKIKSIIIYQEKYEPLNNRKYKELEQSFDTVGNLLEEITYKQGKISKHFRYEYDDNNNKIKEQKIDPSGRVVETSEYKYASGLRVEKITYGPDNKPKSKKTYQYALY
jgi:major membrane immunogen (membrane-anchored lipoprotein)